MIIRKRSPRSLIRPNTKIYRVLKALANGGSFNRFEAERTLHDHVLHTSVATIQRDFGIRVERKWETVPGYQGHPTRVCRYWLTRDECKKARDTLGEISWIASKGYSS